MWHPSDLMVISHMIHGGAEDEIPTIVIRDLLERHREEFDKVKVHLSKKERNKCIESLNALEQYYKLRLLKGKKGKRQNPAPENSKKTPTERYKEIFGTSPTEDYRKQFGEFDKSGYAKWLIERVRPHNKAE